MRGSTQDHVRRRLRGLWVLAAGSALAATLLLAATGSAAAAGHDVTISGFAFGPASVNVNVGDTVTWTNQDGVTHTATAAGGAFNTGPIANGESATVTFDQAGTFTYHCSIHPSMTGTVVVAGAIAATPRPTARTAGASLPATDAAAAAAPNSEAGSMQYGWIILLVAVLAAMATLLRPARRSRRRGRFG